MKKVILTLVVAMFAVGAFAQTTTPKTDSKKDMKDLRKDTRDVRHDKRSRTYDVKHGDKAEAKAETKNIKADKKDMASNVKDLKKDGVKHPVKRAHAQIHRQNVHQHHHA
jgi:maltose-binding protein MalE